MRIVVLRHAEKTGEKKDPHLSQPGKQRAQRLVAYLPEAFGRPQFLIAARTSKRSRRPVETLEPLAEALTLPIYAEFDDEETGELVAVLGEQERFRGKTGVICWRHSDIPRLVQELGASPDTLPGPWHESDYTTIVDIHYPGDGTVHATHLSMPI